MACQFRISRNAISVSSRLGSLLLAMTCLARLNCLSITKEEKLVSLLGSFLQCSIHRFEATLRIPVQTFSHEWNE